MKKLVTFILTVAIMITPVICIANDNVIPEGGQTDTYEFTVIEDEEIPLAGGMEAQNTYNYVLYLGAIALLLGVGFVSKSRADRIKSREAQDIQVAKTYMDDLIK